MIVNVPDHNDLASVAEGWLSLAWGIAIEEAHNVQEFSFALDDATKAHGQQRVQEAMEQYWDGQSLQLNNSLSLLQQSIELFLKSRIAEVSPFLLIAGEPRSWPAPTDKTCNIDFTDLKTIDATQLCRAAQLISIRPLPNSFVEFYERLRKTRNKIVHLNGGNAKAEFRSVLVDILTAHKSLFPNRSWVEFLRRGESAAKEKQDYIYILFGSLDDCTNDSICREVDTALSELDADDAIAFFGYDFTKPAYRCPTCLSRRSPDWSDQEYELVQMHEDKRLKCAACLSEFSVDEYKSAILEFFDYLDDRRKQEIADQLKVDFP